MFRILRLAFAPLMACVLPLAAQEQGDADQERFVRLHTEKLSKAWVSDGRWLTDYDLARKRAAEQGKVIFAYFTRSYAP